MTPRAFSFNSPHGACPECQGLGAVYDFDPARVVPDDSLSLADGAIAPWARGDRKLVREALATPRRAFGIDLDAPVRRLPQEGARPAALRCAGGRQRAARGGTSAGQEEERRGEDPFGAGFEGLIPNLRRRYESGTWVEQENLEPYRALRPCPACAASASRRRAWPCASRAGRSPSTSICRSRTRCAVLDALELTERETLIASRILREIRDRLRFLDDVGVGYLTLGRSAATLSGGEGQRIRLATQIGSNLTGVLYVLDEPSIGLHQRDNRALLATLAGCAISATRSSSSSTTKRRFARPTTSSTSGRAPASTAAT